MASNLVSNLALILQAENFFGNFKLFLASQKPPFGAFKNQSILARLKIKVYYQYLTYFLYNIIKSYFPINIFWAID